MWTERIRITVFLSLLFITMEALAILVIFSTPSTAHEVSPTVIDVTPLPDHQVMVRFKMEPRALLARHNGVEHDAYDDLSFEDVLAELSEASLDLESTIQAHDADRQHSIALKAAPDLGRWDLMVLDTSISDLTIVPSQVIGAAVIRVLDPESASPVETYFASPGESIRVVKPASKSSVIVTYVRSGFDHILPKGLDHILFVVGLFLLSPALRPLLTQVSLFTVAHTATLGLAAAGIVSLPAELVEPLIAASIAFIAIENLFRTSLSRWRPWVVFGFGLLHGLGFASVLSEFGLPSDQFVLALAAFNIGVELGQLTVLALCFLAVGLIFRRPWYRSAVSIPASVLLAGVGMFWFFERIAAGVA